MKSKYDNLLAGKDQTIKALWAALSIATLFALLMGAGWMSAPRFIRVHVPPDLDNGAELATHEVGKANVYAFAFYIWQQLNRWENDGVKDYQHKIHTLQHYLTPACRQDRNEDYAERHRQHELYRRERAIWEIPGRHFSADRVHVESDASWVVYLDVRINETMLGEPVKTRFVHYPLRVVRYRIDPELNPFGLAIDCLADKARAIERLESENNT